MKLIKVFILITTTVGLFLGVSAHPVDQETGRAVAVKFMKTTDMTTAATYSTSNGTPALFIFNTTDGFVIVATDDCETPIIGYSHEGRFNPDDVPVQMQEYLQDFVARIQYGIENQIVADEVTARQWELVKATGRLSDDRSAKAVEPLITTRWHQGCLYNSLCPEMSGPCGHAEVGCVAMAMAQIIKYWGFPEGGNGSHTYNTTIGTYSAPFGNTIYNYGLMPNALSDSSSDEEVAAVATLLYHCGVSVDMYYTASGSGAHSSDVPDALRNYFKYSDEMHRERMSDDPDGWLDKIKTCLDNRRPVLYSGYSSSGHAFVCDGYDDNDLLHFNWGWGGNGDGYYALGNLNPLGHTYNLNNSAIFDIFPNFEPHHVSASASPPEGGTIEGLGDYHCGQQCHLRAVPADNYHLQFWTRNQCVVCYDSVYSLFTDNNIDDIEAVFSLDPVQTIMTQHLPDEPTVSLSWECRNADTWPLLATLNIKSKAIAINDSFIYTSPSTYHTFGKYTMDGELIEGFTVSGTSSISSMTCDGNLFYCKSSSYQTIYQVNMDSHSLIKEIPLNKNSVFCTYDSVNKGIWICEYDNASIYRLKLINRNGSVIKPGTTLPSGIIPNGAVCLTDILGNPLLMIKTQEGLIYQYDVNNNLFFNICLANLEASYGCCAGIYQGQSAMFVCYDNHVKVFQIPNQSHSFNQIVHYRVYRIDDNGDSVTLADKVTGNTYIDTTWEEAEVGLYRYGVSEVYHDGSEHIVWSEPIPKGNYDIDEHTDPFEGTVQKIIENGQIVIIKEGKKYNVTGQQLK